MTFLYEYEPQSEKKTLFEVSVCPTRLDTNQHVEVRRRITRLVKFGIYKLEIQSDQTTGSDAQADLCLCCFLAFMLISVFFSVRNLTRTLI